MFNLNASCVVFKLCKCLVHAGVQLLALLVPTLISYLLDEKAISSAPQVSKGLHEFALQNLMRIGPLYPAAFKIVIGAAPELKIRLESAIRANQASNRAKAAARQTQPTVQAAPTIKLKTSFFWRLQIHAGHYQAELILFSILFYFILFQTCFYLFCYIFYIVLKLLF